MDEEAEEVGRTLEAMYKDFASIGLYCGIWPIKCHQGSKTNKSKFRVWKQLTFDWLVDNPSQDLFGQRPQYTPKSIYIEHSI
jgi:hypothetical protein